MDNFKKWILKNPLQLYRIGFIVLVIVVGSLVIYFKIIIDAKQQQLELLDKNKLALNTQLLKVKTELATVTSEDQFVKNKKLEEEIKNIEGTYTNSISVYEKINDLKSSSTKTDEFNKSLAQIIKLLSDKNFASADAQLRALNQQIEDEKAKFAQQAVISVSQNAPVSNTPPGSGYSIQKVSSDVGEFTVALVAADLATTKVVVDTASDSDCNDNCPVLSLSDYVSRSNAYAGINGSYFCPASYPSCAGKTNSFDLLVMNKNKHYFNSDNNVYSTNPAVIFLGGSVRFVSRALEWGRDTGVDGVISNFPLLVLNDQITYDSSSDPKFNSKGTRNFVANKGNTVYIGIVYNANMRDSAHVLKSMGMNNAINLDEGGSTALWYGGYKAGPGRNIPNAILFIRK